MEIRSRQITIFNRRVLVVSDIHGHVELLRQILVKANYVAGKDILIILGDMIEKGPQSLATLRYIMDLAKEKDVIIIMGNCDAIPCIMYERERPSWLIDYLIEISWKEHTLIHEMCKEQNIVLSKDMDFDKLFDDLLTVYAEELHFLDTLPHVVESECFIFAHGGLYNKQKQYAQNAHQIMKNDYHALQDVQYEKTLVCGHTPVMNYDTEMFDCNPHYDAKRNILSIDGGCGVKAYGQLNLLLIENARYTSIACDALSYYDVVEAYHPKQSESYAIPWVNHEVERLYPGKKGMMCRHIATGHIVEIPDAFLKQQETGWICDDFSDYHIDVAVGDKVAYITTWGEERWIKKNGRIGWIPSTCLAYPKD